MKRFLSFVLAFVLCLSVFQTAVFADGSFEGGHENSFSPGTIDTSHYGGKPKPVGDGPVTRWDSGRGNYGIRMAAFVGSPQPGASGSQEYFTYSSDMKIHQKGFSDLVKAEDYTNVSRWKYFMSGTVSNTGSNFVAFGGDASDWAKGESRSFIHIHGSGASGATQTSIYQHNSSEMKKFVSLCDPDKVAGVSPTKGFLGDSDFLQSLLTSDYLSDEAHKIELGKYFGLSEEEARQGFYIIVEQFVYVYYVYYRDNREEWEIPFLNIAGQKLTGSVLIGMTTATWEAVDTGKATVGYPELMYTARNELFGVNLVQRSTGGKINSIDGKAFAKAITKATLTQTRAPWESFGYSMGNLTNGYAIYGVGEPGSGAAGGNIAVEYQGDVNTSDPGKFVSTGTLIGSGNSTSNAYWDFQQNKWVDSGDTAQLLKFAGKIDTSDEYALCFTGTAGHKLTDEEELNQRLQSAFEDEPGAGYNTSSLMWGVGVPTGGLPIGWVWAVQTLDGAKNVKTIVEKFETAFNRASVKGDLSRGTETDTTAKYKTYEVLDGSWRNASEGMLKSDKDVLAEKDGKTFLNKDKTLGMGYEFIIRGTPVLSQEITMYVTADEDNNVEDVSSAQTWEERYTTAKNVIHEVTEEVGWDFCGWVVVPKQEQSVTNSVESSLRSASDARVGTLLQAAISGASGGPVVQSNPAATTLGIGSTKEDKPPEGYTVYKILRQGPQPTPVTGTVVLPAYMLNRYFNNVIQTSSQIKGVPERITLASDWTWVKWTAWVHCHCRTHKEWPTAWDRDWVHEYRDTASGEEFGLDNAMIDRYYPKGTGNWSGAQRSKLYGHGWTQPVDTGGMSDTVNVVDYAFNLVRNNNGFGDARSISGISYKTYVAGTGDSDDLLRIKSKFGVVPATVKRASPSRNSNAALATYDEVFNIESRFQHDASPIGNHTRAEGWSCSHWHPGRPGYPCSSSGTYYVTEPHTIRGFYGIASGYSDKITYSFSNTAFKYTTKNDLGKGKNDFLGTAQSKPLTAGRRNSTAGSITPSNFYRYTTVRYSGVDLLFHPENYMVFKIGGTDFATINTQNYKAAYVMSEVKRTSQGSGMYFFRLNADITSVPGTVYSDSMQGGTGMMGLGGDLVSIPAGSDVTIAADPTGVAIDLYGYALDIVQTEDDGKIGAVGSGRPYNTVVADGEDAYSKWGNDSRAKIKEHFEKWCADMLEVENYAADFQLFVGNSPASGDLKSENFSATIGSVEKGAGVAEEGIYQLVVEKGVLVESKGDYNALISQISTDYGCSTAEAKQMFKESAIYTAIINGMETCKNPKNKSGDVFQGLNYTPDILASWNGVLGGDGNWYDETSRTFVIRRFTNLGNKLCDVIATDKIDYQLAPEGNARFGEGVNGGVSFEGWWKLNIFFDQNRASEVNDLLLGSSHYYDPQNGSAGFNPANNAYSVLFNGIPVADANFKIPASSTQDFYN